MMPDKYADTGPDFPEQVFLLMFWETKKENVKIKQYQGTETFKSRSRAH